MAEDTAQSGRTETTTEHDTIRDWVEERGSTAAQVLEPAGDDPGSLAIVPEGAEDDSVELISWEEFFEVFKEENLTFVYQADKDDPEEQWFCKFIDHEEEASEDIFEEETPGTTWSAGQRYADRAPDEQGRTAGLGIESGGEEVVDESMIEEGQTAETEVTRTETIEKEIVETDRIQSRVVASEITKENTTDSSVIDREIDHCEIADENTVETEMVETRRVTNEIFETHTVESEVVDSETIEQDLDESDTLMADEPMAEDATADLEDSGLTHGTIVESELVRRDIEEGDLVEGKVIETEVVERRVIETEVDERILIRSEIDSGESIDSRIVDSEMIESEIVERDATDHGSDASVNDEAFESGNGASGSRETMGDVDTGGTDTAGSTGTAGATGSAVNVSDDDEGKSVVNTYGEQIGLVSDVRGETLYVDPNAGLTDKISSSLGWSDANDDDYTIEADQIEEITDDEVEIARL